MNFKFNVITNDQDYLDFNEFHMLRSPYGKKQTAAVRIVVTVIISVFILAFLIDSGFTQGAFVGVVPLVAILVLFEVFFNKLMVGSIKTQIKTMKKRGKMTYTPEAVLEFSEDTFTETSADMKTERKYSTVERISVVDNKMIYIHFF